MKKIAKLGAVLGLVALGGCVGPYDSYESSTYYSGYGAGPYDNGPARYETYYGPDYYADRPYYGGGGYRAYNPGRQDGGNYRRGAPDGQRDGQRGGQYRGDGQRGDQRGPRGDGNRSEARPQQQRPQAQAQPQWQPQPGVSTRTQMFGGGNYAPAPAPSAPAPAASAPPPTPPIGWNGFQGRNPNDPNNTD
jgi:hypothetical protein